MLQQALENPRWYNLDATTTTVHRRVKKMLDSQLVTCQIRTTTVINSKI
jgi:hypothetical protein